MDIAVCDCISIFHFITSAKEVMFSPVSVCLFVSLSYNSIFQKLLIKSNFVEWLDIMKGPID